MKRFLLTVLGLGWVSCVDAQLIENESDLRARCAFTYDNDSSSSPAPYITNSYTIPGNTITSVMDSAGDSATANPAIIWSQPPTAGAWAISGSLSESATISTTAASLGQDGEGQIEVDANSAEYLLFTITEPVKITAQVGCSNDSSGYNYEIGNPLFPTSSAGASASSAEGLFLYTGPGYSQLVDSVLYSSPTTPAQGAISMNDVLQPGSYYVEVSSNVEAEAAWYNVPALPYGIGGAAADSYQINITAVPEPGAWLGLGSALGLLGFSGLRRTLHAPSE